MLKCDERTDFVLEMVDAGLFVVVQNSGMKFNERWKGFLSCRIVNF